MNDRVFWTYIAVLAITLLCLLLIIWFYHWKPRVEAHRYGPFVDPNAKCPACGNKDGSLKMTMGLQDGKQGERPWIKHICKICSAEWMEETVVAIDSWWKPPLVK